MNSRKSSTAAMVAPALPSSVASPHPTTPWSVSIFTNTYGRSESGVSDTPIAFMLVTLMRGAGQPPPGSCATSAGAQAQSLAADRRAVAAAAENPVRNWRRFMARPSYQNRT
jgi:hypothetical protein